MSGTKSAENANASPGVEPSISRSTVLSAPDRTTTRPITGASGWNPSVRCIESAIPSPSRSLSCASVPALPRHIPATTVRHRFHFIAGPLWYPSAHIPQLHKYQRETILSKENPTLSLSTAAVTPLFGGIFGSFQHRCVSPCGGVDSL